MKTRNIAVGNCDTCKWDNCGDNRPCDGCTHKIHKDQNHTYNCLCLQPSEDGKTCKYYEERTNE